MKILPAVPSICVVAIFLLASADTTAAQSGEEAAKIPKKQESGVSQLKSFTNSIGMKFAWIPPGDFMMGSPPTEPMRVKNELQHKVTLTKGFYMSVNLVTQKQWQEVMGSNPSRFKGDDSLPVESVNWHDAQAFIRKLSGRDKTPYRLPTEAEWEYACRAGTTTPFHFGETISANQANYRGSDVYGAGTPGVNREKTTPTGNFQANAWGLFDMHGNMWQWCQDWHGPYTNQAATDPSGPKLGQLRALRGGAWNARPSDCRSAFRHAADPATRQFGLRLCCSDSFPLQVAHPSPSSSGSPKEPMTPTDNPNSPKVDVAQAQKKPAMSTTDNPKNQLEREKVPQTKPPLFQEANNGIATLNDRLEQDSPKDRIRENSGHKVHKIKMTKNVLYNIELASMDFDAYLRLEDSDWNRLAEEGNGGSNRNARLSFRAPKDGIYRIIANTLNGGFGSYILSVRGDNGLVPIFFSQPEVPKMQETNILPISAFYEWGHLPVRPDTQGQVAISPDGSILASGGKGKDCRIYIFELASGRTRHTLECHTGDITGLAFSRDSKLLFSSSSDGSVCEWEVESGRMKRQRMISRLNISGVGLVLNQAEHVTVASIMPGGAADHDGRFKVGDRLVAVSDPDGKMVPVHRMPMKEILQLLSGDAGSSVVLEMFHAERQDTYKLEVKRTQVRVLAPILAMSLSPDDNTLAIGCTSETKSHTQAIHVSLLDAKTLRETLTFVLGYELLTSLSFSPDGKTLISAGDKIATIWEASSGKHLTELKGHEAAVCSAAFHPKGQSLATVGTDRSVKLWSAPSWKLATALTEHSIAGIEMNTPGVFSSDGRFLAVGGGGGTVEVWDNETGKRVQSLKLPSYKGVGGVVSLAFSPDRTLLAASSTWDKNVHIWGAVRSGSAYQELQELLVNGFPLFHEANNGHATLNDRLERYSSKDRIRKNSGHNVHKIKMTKDALYTIDMASMDFDAYLRLEDSDWTRLADEGNGGGKRDARLSYRAPKDGIYRIIATTFDGGVGSYTLSVRSDNGVRTKEHREFVVFEEKRLNDAYGFSKLDYTKGPNGEALEKEWKKSRTSWKDAGAIGPKQDFTQTSQGFLMSDGSFVKHGRFVETPDKDSVRCARIEGWFYNGKKHGMCVDLGADDTVYRICAYKDDLLHGSVQSWYFNLAACSHGQYKDDKMEGTWKYKYDNGKDWKEFTHKGGKLHGKHTIWGADGKVVEQLTFDDGRLNRRATTMAEFMQFLKRCGETSSGGTSFVGRFKTDIFIAWVGEPDRKQGEGSDLGAGLWSGNYQFVCSDGVLTFRANRVRAQNLLTLERD